MDGLVKGGWDRKVKEGKWRWTTNTKGPLKTIRTLTILESSYTYVKGSHRETKNNRGEKTSTRYLVPPN